MRKVLWTAAALSALAACTNENQTQTEKKADVRPPNIVFVLADDLGYGDLSCNGQQRFTTPHIDAIARNGMNFTQFYSNQAVCAPSRCSILTGKHQGHALIRGNSEVQPEGQGPMPSSEITFSKLLHQNGYATACIGKWGLGAPGSDGVPANHGFDLFYGTNCQREAHFYYPDHVWRNDEKIMLPGNHKAYGTDYAPDLYVREGVKFIAENKDKPFFLWYTTPIPHASLQVPDSYRQKFIGKYDEKPFKTSHYIGTETPGANFAGMVTHLDDEVGALVAELKKQGVYENTIIIFASDNGPSVEGGHDLEYFNSRGLPTRGKKGDLLEGGVRVPFMIQWNKAFPAQKVCNQTFAFMDVFPTVLEAVGIDYDKTRIDGVSLMPLLTGNNQKQVTHDNMYWEFVCFDGQVAVRRGAWKLWAGQAKAKKKLDFKLYNLDTDPGEKTDLSAQHPDIVRELQAIIVESRVPSNVKKFEFPLLDEFCKNFSQK